MIWRVTDYFFNDISAPFSSIGFFLYTLNNHYFPRLLPPSPYFQNLYRLHGTRFYLKDFFFSCGEDVLATPLSDVQNAFTAVQVGSYPSVSSRNSYLVKVMLESRDVSLLTEASAHWMLLLSVCYCSLNTRGVH